MPESVDRIDDRTAESDIISYQKVNYISVFLSFFIICLTAKSFLTDWIFFFYENSLAPSVQDSLSLALIQNESLTGVI